jgi:hypothetical protein
MLLAFSLEIVSLTDEGADPNHVGANNRIPPVVWAAHHGYHRVLKVGQICTKLSIIAFTAFAMVEFCTHKKFLPPIGTFCKKKLLRQPRTKRLKKRKTSFINVTCQCRYTVFTFLLIHFHVLLQVFKRKFIEKGIAVDFSATDNNVRKENILHKILKVIKSALKVFLKTKKNLPGKE